MERECVCDGTGVSAVGAVLRGGAYLGLRLPAVQRVQVVHGALGGRQRVREDLEDVEVVAQGVRRHQQHAWTQDTGHRTQVSTPKQATVRYHCPPCWDKGTGPGNTSSAFQCKN